MVRLATSFVIGLLIGVSVMALRNANISAPPEDRPQERLASVTVETEPQIENLSPSETVSALPIPPPSTTPVQVLTQDNGPVLPVSYRQIIGPAKPRLTFSERWAQFESEPRDESWALPMEAGINNFVAAHAAESGAVIEFVQCRLNWCVLAGYFLPGNSDDTSRFISPMKRETWWQGGNYTSSYGLKIGDNEAFVTMMSRFDRQR